MFLLTSQHHCMEGFVWITGVCVFLILPWYHSQGFKSEVIFISTNVNIASCLKPSKWKILHHSDHVYIFAGKKKNLSGRGGEGMGWEALTEWCCSRKLAFLVQLLRMLKKTEKPWSLLSAFKVWHFILLFLLEK